MGETPEGPMPGKQEKQESGQKARKYLKYDLVVELGKQYDAAVELVSMLRGLGVYLHAKCPKCGTEGSISVLRHTNGYNYIVIRHPDRSTHMVSRNQVSEVFKELCEVKKDLEYIINQYRKYEENGVKFCIEGQ
jgi:hypothetical protein